MILEVVVRIGDVVLAGVGVLGGHRNSPIRRPHVLDGGDTVTTTPVRVTSPCRVHLRQVLVGAPILGIDQLQQSRAIGTGLGAEDPGRGPVDVTVFCDVGPGVCGNEVHIVRFIKSGHHPDRVVEDGHHMGEGVAEESGDAHGDVDTRSAEFGGLNQVEGGDPSRGLVPDRHHSEEGEYLGDVVARCAHGTGPPHRQSDRLRVLAMVFEVALEQ